MLYHLNRLVLPLIVSNIIHMIVIKRNWFPGLARPVNTAAFGENKTWRGFLLLPVLNGLAVMLFAYDTPLAESFVLGAVLGLVYMLFELPNSFIKRRVGVAAGARPTSNQYLFMAMDKTDSALGVSLAYYLMTDVSA